MKYKVGDKVKIKSLDWYNENKNRHGEVCSGNYYFNGSMSLYCGSILTIEFIDNEIYWMKENLFKWTDDMIEGLVKEEIAITTDEPLFKTANVPLEKGMEWSLPDGYQFVDENGNVINATKIVLEKKTYPKTREECYRVLNYCFSPTITKTIHKEDLIRKFQFLLLYRDAYWKIAGEEMGLGKSWEPDWEGEGWYVIVNHRGDIVTDVQWHANAVLAFPTEEMRDEFYENFKDLINECKELL